MPPAVRHLRLVLAVVTISIGGSGACLERGDPDSSTSSLRLAPCSVAGIERTTECGTLSVPENVPAARSLCG